MPQATTTTSASFLPSPKAIPAHWDAPFHVTHPRSEEENAQRYRLAFCTTRYSLRSPHPYQEVHLPIQLWHGLPYAPVTWGKKRGYCLVDTGSKVITWPQWQKLDTDQIDVAGRMTWIGGKVTAGEWTRAKNIRLGDYELFDMPTCAVGVAKPSSRYEQYRQSIILGNDTFLPTVFTIDYPRKELVFRSHDFDVTRQPLSAGARLLDMTYDHDRHMLVAGTVAGHSARFLIDTGCYTLVMKPDFYRRHLAFMKRNAGKGSSNYGTFKTEQIGGVSVDIADKTIALKQAEVSDFNSDADAIAGAPVLKQFRITIDYWRRKVLFEPAAQSLARPYDSPSLH